MLGKLIDMLWKFIFKAGGKEYVFFKDVYENITFKRILYSFGVGLLVTLIVTTLPLAIILAIILEGGTHNENYIGTLVIIGLITSAIFTFPSNVSLSVVRKKFISCPECGQETKIIEDDLFSEEIVTEWKKNNTEHFRVGTRKVKIACNACDYAKVVDLKFRKKV